MKKFDCYLFYISSSRGYSAKRVVKFPAGTDIATVKEYRNKWYEIVSPKKSETTYTVGHKKIKLPTHTKVLSEWNKIWRRKEKIDEKVEILRAMLNPQEVKNIK